MSGALTQASPAAAGAGTGTATRSAYLDLSAIINDLHVLAANPSLLPRAALALSPKPPPSTEGMEPPLRASEALNLAEEFLQTSQEVLYRSEGLEGMMERCERVILAVKEVKNGLEGA